MSLAVEGYGSFVERSPNGVTFNTVAEVYRIVGPGAKVTPVEATHLLSPSNRKEFFSGLVDEGEVKLELNFTSAEWLALHATILTTANSGTGAMPFWRVTFSTGNIMLGQGFITDIEPTAPVDDKITKTVTIKCTGLWTLT